jgi:hypothetical protein
LSAWAEAAIKPILAISRILAREGVTLLLTPSLGRLRIGIRPNRASKVEGAVRTQPEENEWTLR